MKTATYPEPVVGVYAINKKGELLVIKSSKWGDQWIIHGGHVEVGETVFEAAKRETLEEVGIRVKPLGVLTVFEAINPKGFHQKRHFIYIELLCEALTDTVKMDGDEVTDYAWVAPTKALKIFKDAAAKETVRTLIKWRAGKAGFINVRIPRR